MCHLRKADGTTFSIVPGVSLNGQLAAVPSIEIPPPDKDLLLGNRFWYSGIEKEGQPTYDGSLPGRGCNEPV